MKKLLVVGVLSMLTLGFAYSNDSNKINPNEYYVVMKFSSGNTIALSDKITGYDACTSSDEYILHKTMSNQSQSNIQCTNSLPTYR